MLNPTTVTDRYWLREVLPVDEVNNPGKWLLFFPPDRVDDGWEEIRQMFLDGERIKENVVLWTEAQALSHLAQIVLDVMAVDDGIARRRLDKT